MANKYKYSYGRKVTEEKYKAEKLMLPVDCTIRINGIRISAIVALIIAGWL